MSIVGLVFGTIPYRCGGHGCGVVVVIGDITYTRADEAFLAFQSINNNSRNPQMTVRHIK
jgi:hypothetical protein